MSKYNRVANRQLKLLEKIDQIEKRNSVGMKFATEKELREYMGSAIPKGQEYCAFCGRLKKIGKPCVCKYGGVFG